MDKLTDKNQDSTETVDTASEEPKIEETKVEAVPPEVVGDPPEDADVIGTATKEELATLGSLRQRANQITVEIGNLEIRKARLLGTISSIEARAQALLDETAKRLGVKEGQTWQLGPDGKVRIVKDVAPVSHLGLVK